MAPFFLCCLIVSLGAASSAESPLQARRAQAAGGAAPVSGSVPASGSSGSPSAGGTSTDHADGSETHNARTREDVADESDDGKKTASWNTGNQYGSGSAGSTGDANLSLWGMSGDTLATLVGVLIAVNGFTCIMLCVVMYVRREKFWYDPMDTSSRRGSKESAAGEKKAVDDGSFAPEVEGA